MNKKDEHLFDLADDIIIDLYLLLQETTAPLDDAECPDFIRLRKCQKYLSGRGIELNDYENSK